MDSFEKIIMCGFGVSNITKLQSVNAKCQKRGPEVLFSWLKDRYGFEVLYFQDRNGGGNFTGILRKIER